MPDEVPSELMEKILNSPAGRRAVSYNTTGIYRDSYVGLWLFQVIGLEWDEVENWIKELPRQRFPDLVTWGIRWWEEAYSLPVDDTLPLEVRRARLKTHGRAGGPVNPARLEQIVQDATGFRVHIEENVSPYTFRVNVTPKELPFEDLLGIFRLLRPKKQSHQTMEVRIILHTAPGTIYLVSRSNYALRAGVYPFQPKKGGVSGDFASLGAVKYGIRTGVKPILKGGNS